MVAISKCKCGKTADNLIVSKSFSVGLCGGHVRALEVYLGQELDPLTAESNLFTGLFLSL